MKLKQHPIYKWTFVDNNGNIYSSLYDNKMLNEYHEESLYGPYNYNPYIKVKIRGFGFMEYAHRIIWECLNQSKIPDGYIVHHINKNKIDNNIKNLECISYKLHNEKHSNIYE